MDGDGVSTAIIAVSILLVIVVILIILVLVLIVVVIFIKKWFHASVDLRTHYLRKLGKLCVMWFRLTKVIVYHSYVHITIKETSNDDTCEEEHCLIIPKDIVIKMMPEKDLVLGPQLRLREIYSGQRCFTRHHVTKNCSLKEFVHGCGLTFTRGCAFYEFKYIEDISADEEVILMHEVLSDNVLLCTMI